jgi:hypothetical protein
MPRGRSRPRITFVHAAEDFYDQNYGTQFIPLWAYCLSAHVPPGWDIRIIDCKNEDPTVAEPADVFAFSGLNQDFAAIERIWGLLHHRYPSARFVLGGPITWSYEQDGKISQLEYFDHIFILDGEQTLPAFLEWVESDDGSNYPKIVRGERFSLENSKRIPFELFRSDFRKYYGGVVEVSRGCPFLCEFCDIRVLPDNNRANNKPPELIVEELDAYYSIGITHIQFACDNFIGDVAWTRECLDAILAWKRRRKADLAIFTWLTINLYKYPDVMEKMREAGFSILFIGIESVNQNSLLETAKVQNMDSLTHAATMIQSYGFIIAPGFIFGFDSDDEEVFKDTLRFFSEAGLIGGDPSFLMALPGTPLYDRMSRTGRLVEARPEGVVRKKIDTNIRYLQDDDFLANGFLGFIAEYNSPKHQIARFHRLLDSIIDGGRYIPVAGPGYSSPRPYLALQMRRSEYARMAARRLRFLLSDPKKVWAILEATRRLARELPKYPGLSAHFLYWIYAWSNIGLKYEGLTRDDFALHSVGPDYSESLLVALPRSNGAEKGGTKNAAQARFTNRALSILDEKRRAKSSGRAG